VSIARRSDIQPASGSFANSGARSRLVSIMLRLYRGAAPTASPPQRLLKREVNAYQGASELFPIVAHAPGEPPGRMKIARAAGTVPSQPAAPVGRSEEAIFTVVTVQPQRGGENRDGGRLRRTVASAAATKTPCSAA
jgi:hypothetical protein